MANILDLKNPRGAPAPPAEQPATLPAAQEPEDFTDGQVPGEPSLPMALLAALAPENAAWTASVRPDALERRKEHVLLATLGGIALAVALWQGSWALALIAALVVATWEIHHHVHHEVKVAIDREGVGINGHKHRYAGLKSFFIQEMPDGTHHLSLVGVSRFSLPIRAQLGDQDPGPVRALLTQHLLEEHHPIPISELFLKS